jgi:hypothetical protein
LWAPRRGRNPQREDLPRSLRGECRSLRHTEGRSSIVSKALARNGPSETLKQSPAATEARVRTERRERRRSGHNELMNAEYHPCCTLAADVLTEEHAQ